MEPVQVELMSQTINHQTINGKYRVKFERAASANKTDGFVVEANGDDLNQTLDDARMLYGNALLEIEKNKPVISALAK